MATLDALYDRLALSAQQLAAGPAAADPAWTRLQKLAAGANPSDPWAALHAVRERLRYKAAGTEKTALYAAVGVCDVALYRQAQADLEWRHTLDADRIREVAG